MKSSDYLPHIQLNAFHPIIPAFGVHHTNLLLGHHTLGIECKGVLSTGVDRTLVGNRVGVPA